MPMVIMSSRVSRTWAWSITTSMAMELSAADESVETDPPPPARALLFPSQKGRVGALTFPFQAMRIHAESESNQSKRASRGGKLARCGGGIVDFLC